MAGDNGSRRFRLWWVLAAFMLGAALGALCGNLMGVYPTLWLTIGVGGSLLVVGVMFDRLGERRMTPRPVRRAPRKATVTGLPVPPSKVSLKGKPSGTRGQLHAIGGKKTADPPSTGSTGS